MYNDTNTGNNNGRHSIFLPLLYGFFNGSPFFLAIPLFVDLFPFYTSRHIFLKKFSFIGKIQARTRAQTKIPTRVNQTNSREMPTTSTNTILTIFKQHFFLIFNIVCFIIHKSYLANFLIAALLQMSLINIQILLPIDFPK